MQQEAAYQIWQAQRQELDLTISDVQTVELAGEHLLTTPLLPPQISACRAYCCPRVQVDLMEDKLKISCMSGLCHDLGHGPFSHVFDGEFLKRSGITDWCAAVHSSKKRHMKAPALYV